MTRKVNRKIKRKKGKNQRKERPHLSNRDQAPEVGAAEAEVDRRVRRKTTGRAKREVEVAEEAAVKPKTEMIIDGREAGAKMI